LRIFRLLGDGSFRAEKESLGHLKRILAKEVMRNEEGAGIVVHSAFRKKETVKQINYFLETERIDGKQLEVFL